MDDILDYFIPVPSPIIEFAIKLNTNCLGQIIQANDGKKTIDITSNSFVIFSVAEDNNAINNLGTGGSFINFRKQFYSLFKGNWNNSIFDLGSLKIGQNFSDTEEALKYIVSQLVKQNIFPIVLGGSQALTYSLYRAFDYLEKKVNLCVLDSKFDLGSMKEHINSSSYLTNIIMEQPNNLLNYTNIGYQTFLNPQEEIDLIDTMLFEAYRLGDVKNEIVITEPTLRETDLLSIDIGVIKSSDAPANGNRSISGFSAEEICKITRYAGLSSNLSVFGIFEYNEKLDIADRTSELLAQMIWYYIEGVNFRIKEFPNSILRGFSKYIVLIDDEEYNFFKSNTSSRWWMEISIEKHNKQKRRTLVPCTYSDYVKATHQEIPKRWLLNRRKLN